jgi:hypothetical protein
MPDSMEVIRVTPEGLERCSQCGELKGEFLHRYDDEEEPELTRALCLCDGIVCRHCKKGAIRRPISDHYDEETGQVWHTPWFGYLLMCAYCRGAEDAGCHY